MGQSLFELPEAPLIPITGEAAVYPVGRIFCVGRNYAAHAAEMGNEVDREAPFYFTKAAANAVLTGGGCALIRQAQTISTMKWNWLWQLGRRVFRATKEAAVASIFGYGCALDMTRRDLQIRERQKQRPWDLGKDLENGTVLAPLTRAAGWDGPEGQRIWLEVNGETRQEATLAEMIWSCSRHHLPPLRFLPPSAGGPDPDWHTCRGGGCAGRRPDTRWDCRAGAG